MSSKKKQPSSNLHAKFYNGLAQFRPPIEDIDNYKYCGGNIGRHLNYFRQCYPEDELPELQTECICGTSIKENCYIIDPTETEILVLGNCCIKAFCPNSSRTCKDCGKPHRNRIGNQCNKCRKGKCDRCRGECDYKKTRCYFCMFKK